MGESHCDERRDADVPAGPQRSRTAERSGFGPSKPFAQLGLEIGDAVAGSGELTTAIAQVGFEHRKVVAGVVQCADLVAQGINLAGPARLVRFLAVLGEGGGALAVDNGK
jgi:hypothetical protein